MRKILPLFLLLFSGCAQRMSSTSSAINHTALEEVRIALLDVRQAFSSQRMDIQLLEEKINKLNPSKSSNPRDLENRILTLEKQSQSILQDLQQLRAHANETSSSLVTYRNQINALDSLLKKQNNQLAEIVKLKSTLESISNAIDGSAPSSEKTHTVRAGDSLEKIARRYNTSVNSLKQANRLKSNTILIGQELQIP